MYSSKEGSYCLPIFSFPASLKICEYMSRDEADDGKG